MPGVYANLFSVEANDMARIVFSDQRAPLRVGMPAPASPAADVVMTRENALQLGQMLVDKFGAKT